MAQGLASLVVAQGACEPLRLQPCASTILFILNASLRRGYELQSAKFRLRSGASGGSVAGIEEAGKGAGFRGRKGLDRTLVEKPPLPAAACHLEEIILP